MMARWMIVAAALALLTAQTRVHAQNAFSYQGRLEKDGAPTDGLANFIFTLWNTPAGGTQIGSAVILANVPVVDGLFTVEVDFGADVFNTATSHLEIEVESPFGSGVYETLTPRTPILTVPKAQYASQSRQWKSSGSGITNASDLFVGVNRDSRVTLVEYFGIRAPINSGYGGMYISTDGGNARPFYGYSTGTESGTKRTAWHYLDGVTGDFRLNLNGFDRFKMSLDGRVGINSEPNNDIQLHVDSSVSAINGSSMGDSRTGVSGFATGVSGVGVSGTATGLQGIGVYGETTGANGFGGYFVGEGYFSDRLGIGANNPAHQLHVLEDSDGLNAVHLERTVAALTGSDLLELVVAAGSSPGAQLIEAQVGTNVVFKVNASGDVFADGTFTGGGADFAEMVPITDGYETVRPGDVIVLDPTTDGGFAMSQTPRSTLVAGIYSTKPGLLGSTHDWDDVARALADTSEGDEPPHYNTLDLGATIDEIPLAMIGIVPCKVSAENGAIRPGDLLVTAALPGHAMRDENPRNGTIVGKAMGTLEHGTGIIRVLVTLQ